MSLWLLASPTLVIIGAAATGYRSLILLACLYGTVILTLYFATVS